MQTPSTTDHTLGKILAKGKPLDAPFLNKGWLLNCVVWSILNGILAMLPYAVFSFVAAMSGGMRVFDVPVVGVLREEHIATFLFWGGIIVAVWLILRFIYQTTIFYQRIAEMEITVHENGVAGTGGGKGYQTHRDMSLYNFSLTWDTVTEISPNGTTLLEKTITINDSDAEYNCCIENPLEMYNIIFEQRRKATTSTEPQS